MVTSDARGVVVQVDGSSAVVTLRGEIDAALQAVFDDTIDAGELAGRSVTVDLAPVTFIDSTGIGFLLRLRSLAHGDVRLLHTNAFTRKLLEITGLTDMFDVVAEDPPRHG